MIPEADEDGNLPPGIHPATPEEIQDRFAGTERRKRLLEGLMAALRALKRSGCRTVYLDGSFVTTKAEPGDFDACWDPRGVNPDLLDDELLDFTNGRASQKQRYGGELFLTTASANPGGTGFIEFFQTDKATGNPKGIVLIDLSEIQNDQE